MKLKNFSILFITMLFLSTFSCSNTANKSRKPVSKITITPNKTKFVVGDSFQVEIKVDPKNGSLSKAELYLDDQLIQSSTDLNFNYTVTNINSVGEHKFKIVATKTDGVAGENFLSFEVLSDVVPEQFTYEIVNTYPHNTDHFTQGLEFYNGDFYESTGENGKSAIYKFDLKSGSVLKSFDMEEKYFGEGMTIFNNKIYQITYKAQKGFIYDLNTFARIDSFTYETPEGWGLTHDSKYIIKTDGSEYLHFLDPTNLNVVKKLPVYDNTGAVKYINELEYSKGYIYANVWTTDYIVKIDAETGKVIAKINLNGLLSSTYKTDEPIDVLNGIAINPENDKMYVTGKLWPKLFEIKLIKKD